VRALVVTDFGATPELLDIQRAEPAVGEVRSAGAGGVGQPVRHRRGRGLPEKA